MAPLEISQHYEGAIELFFSPEYHSYYVPFESLKGRVLPDGTPLVDSVTNENGKVFMDGVTSALKIIDKPALMPWVAKMSSECFREIVRPGVALDEVQFEAAAREIKEAYKVRGSTATDIGSLFHKWVEDHVGGFKPALPVNELLRNCVEKFLAWEKKYKPIYLESEAKVLSLNHQYAGTIDLIVDIGGKIYLVDLKTSSGIWKEYWLQTAAYQLAREEEFNQKFDGNIIIRCGKDGSFEIAEQNEYDKNIAAFLAALTLARRMKDLRHHALKI